MPAKAVLLIIFSAGGSDSLHVKPWLPNHVSCRSPPPVCAARDDFVLQGDAAVLLGYGCIQGVVDVSFAPLATQQPQLFDLLVGQPVFLPSLQGVVMAAAWVATGILLHRIDFLNPYDVKRTRGVDFVTAAAVAIAPWVATCVPMLVALGCLHSAGFGPGLATEEVDFLVGAYVVTAGWRVVACSVLPPI